MLNRNVFKNTKEKAVIYFHFYVYECLPTCMYVYHMHTWCPWVLDSLEVEFQMIVNYHVSSGNQPMVLCKISKCS